MRLALALTLACAACGGGGPSARPEPVLHAHAPAPTPAPPPPRLRGRPRPPPDDRPAPPGAVEPTIPHPYTFALASILASRWTLPRGIPQIASLSAVACLAVDPSGRLDGLTFQQASGFTEFDASVGVALTADPSYPPPPPLPPNLANGLCFRFHAK